MFRNLDAEQARNHMNNTDVAEYLGISRVAYERRKKSGKFSTDEVKKLCDLFKCSFEYLFDTTKEETA